MNASIAERIQAALLQENLDGWLFYSFRSSDPIAENIRQLDHARFETRRWFYFVPAVGEPTRLVHAIGSEMLDALPGEKTVYLPWQQLHSHLADIRAGSPESSCSTPHATQFLAFRGRRRHGRTRPKIWCGRYIVGGSSTNFRRRLDG